MEERHENWMAQYSRYPLASSSPLQIGARGLQHQQWGQRMGRWCLQVHHQEQRSQNRSQLATHTRLLMELAMPRRSTVMLPASQVTRTFLLLTIKACSSPHGYSEPAHFCRHRCKGQRLPAVLWRGVHKGMWDWTGSWCGRHWLWDGKWRGQVLLAGEKLVGVCTWWGETGYLRMERDVDVKEGVCGIAMRPSYSNCLIYTWFLLTFWSS